MSKNYKKRNTEGYDKKYFLKPESYTIGEIANYVRSDEPYVVLDNTRVKVQGLRLNTFTEHTVCASCERAGTHFRIASNNDSKKGPISYHLTLWSDDKIQMTKDHIIPASKGGADHISNMQCMCTKCNSKKGNVMTKEDLEKGSLVENYAPENFPDKSKSQKKITKSSTGESYTSILRRYDPDHKYVQRDEFRQSYIGKLSTKVSKWSEENRLNVYTILPDNDLWELAKSDGILEAAMTVLDCVTEIVDIYQGTFSVEHRVMRLVPKKQRRKLLQKWRQGEEDES